MRSLVGATAAMVLLALSGCIKSGPRGGPPAGQQNAAATGFRLESAVSTARFGQCVAVTLQAIDDKGQPRTPTGAENYTGAVAAVTGDAIDSLFSDAACGTRLTSLTLAAGSSSLRFYVPLIFLGTSLVTASTNDVKASLQFAVQGEAAAGFHVYYAGTTGTCVPVQVGPVDAKGKPTTFTSATTAQVSVAAGSIHAFSDAQCATAATTLSFSAAQTFATIYVSDAVYEVSQLTFTAGAVTATVNVVLAPSPVEQLTVSGSATNPSATCVGPYQITLENVNGDPVPAPQNFVIVAKASNVAGSPSVAFFSNSGCTQPANPSIRSGGTSSRFYVRAASAGSVTLYAAESVGGIPTVNPISVVFQ